MINRGLTKKSQYIFNSKTGMLEKKEENKQTIESLSKQASKHVGNLSDIAKEVNKKKDKHPMNQITVITSADNLIHNYFYDFEHSWDASNCLSTATIKMPKMDTENVNYWATYQDTVTIYGGYNYTLDKVNSQSHASEQEAANSLAQYREDADIIPFFRGTISRIKEYQTYIVLYIDSIGIRFKQKIPEEFRQSYINGQNVRDAFQAICEFLGVQYICPPQLVNETAEDTGETGIVGTNGTENDVSQQQSTAENVVNTAKNIVQQSQEQQQSQQQNQQQSNGNQQGILSNDTNAQDANAQNTDTQNTTDQSGTLTDNQEIDVQLNGYSDISFDANGAITHNSTVIETSPDMAQTLLKMEENPLERYLEDETGIVEKVQNFLKGDMFDEIHNSVMDYGAITIQPKSTTSSDISSSTDTNTNSTDLSGTGDSSNNNGSSGGSNVSKTSGRTGGNVSKKTTNGWSNGQYFINGKIYLSKSYINTLSPEQARQKRTQAYHNQTYTDDTMKKLLWRSLGQKLK